MPSSSTARNSLLDDPERQSTFTDYAIEDIEEVVVELDGVNDNATPKPITILSPRWHIIKAVGFLSPEALAHEPSLMATRWPGYYGLSPQRANVQFAEDYVDQCRLYWDRYIDRLTVGKVKGINLEEIQCPRDHKGQKAKGSSQLTSINTARQIADRHGLPYAEFIAFCLDFQARRPLAKYSPGRTSSFPWKASGSPCGRRSWRPMSKIGGTRVRLLPEALPSPI